MHVGSIATLYFTESQSLSLIKFTVISKFLALPLA